MTFLLYFYLCFYNSFYTIALLSAVCVYSAADSS